MPLPGRSVPDAATAFERILGQLRRTVVSLSDSSHDLDAGWAVRTPSLPLVHALNQVHVGSTVTVDEVLALAEKELGDLPYRHLRVSDAGTAEAMVGALRGGGGWRIEREVVMALGEGGSALGEGGSALGERGGGRRDGGERVSELSEDEMLSLMRRWIVEDHLDTAAGVLDQLCEHTRREGRLWHERVLGVRGEDGVPVALTKVRIEGGAEGGAGGGAGGGVGWVEDVYTVPEARGRGYARTLVTHAAGEARRARPDLVFIIADDEDWPKNLYADIGFRPVGFVWQFHHEEVV